MNKEILRLAVPSIISNVTVPLLGLIDVAIVGHIGDATYIGAIAIGSMVFNVIYWLFGFLRMGTSGMTAQAFGGGDRTEVVRLLRQALTIGLSIALCFLVLQRPLCSLALWLMNTPAEITPLVRTYFNIVIWGAPAMLSLYGLTGWFIGIQNTRIPMTVAIFQNIVNIVVSLVLVVGFKMKMEGVATGTLVAQWSGVLLALWFASRKRWSVEDGMRTDAPVDSASRHSLREILKNYSDIFLRTVCLVAVNLFFTSAGAKQGTEILAVNTLLMTLFMLFSYVMDGFAFAGEALSGRFVGAQDGVMLRRTVRHLFLWGAAMVVLFTLVYVVGGAPFLTLLTSDDSVVSAAVPYLPWAWAVPIAGVAAFIFDGVFIGMTATRGMLLSSALATILFFSVYFLLVPAWHNHALWFAFILYLLTRGIIQTVLYANRSLIP